MDQMNRSTSHLSTFETVRTQAVDRDLYQSTKSIKLGFVSSDDRKESSIVNNKAEGECENFPQMDISTEIQLLFILYRGNHRLEYIRERSYCFAYLDA